MGSTTAILISIHIVVSIALIALIMLIPFRILLSRIEEISSIKKKISV